jgi:methionine-rich copper-binding protein CopC
MHATPSRDAARRSRPRARAAGAALLLLLALPGGVSAHAELVTSTPADGETLTTVPAEAVLTFSEGVGAKSTVVVLDGTGATVATGEPGPDGSTVIRVPLPGLSPGPYEVRWTTVADDGHIERGTFSFTIAASTPAPATATPTEAPTAEPAATTTPTASPNVTPEPSPATVAEGGDPGAGSDVLLPILAVAVLIGGGLIVMLRRRGPA